MAENGAALWRKGLGLWIGTGAIGSVLGTLAADVYAGGNLAADIAQDFNRRVLLTLMELGLIFTLGGSALLALVYSAARQRFRQGAAYAVVILVGVAVGAILAVWGMIYAAVTSVAWVSLHRLLFGRERAEV